MASLQDVFKIIEGREWDNFGNLHRDVKLSFDDSILIIESYNPDNENNDLIGCFTLADLLANKSFCVAVWGEEVDCSCGGTGSISGIMTFHSGDCKISEGWKKSWEAFQILQSEGTQPAIEYIMGTIKK